MKFKPLFALGFLAFLVVTAHDADAARMDFQQPDPTQRAASIYGKTLPPLGYVEFCKLGEEECLYSSGKSDRLKLTSQVWDQVQQVNSYVNNKIQPETDAKTYGKPDLWTYPIDIGDCEDYALLKKRYLQELGFSNSQMVMTVVLDEKNEGHAILTLITSKGDFILDNRRDEIMLWNKTGYTFLKRQSQQQANNWVSLQKIPGKGAKGQVSASNKTK